MLRFEEDAVGHGGGDRLPGPLDLELDPYLAVLDGDHGEPDVLLQTRRVAGRRDLADPLAPLVNREVVDHGAVVVRPAVATADLDADELAADALFADLTQGFPSDEILLLLQFDHPLVAVAHLVGVGVVPHVSAQGQDTALDPAYVAGPNGRDPVWLTSLQHPIPELQPVAARVLQVKLVAELARVSRARDHQLHAVEPPVHHVVVGHVEDVLAEEVRHDLLGLRALHLHRADVGLRDLYVQPHVVGEPLRPQQHVAVRQREPEMVLLEPQQHRVVDNAALGVDDKRVLALLHVALVQVARREHVGELERVGADDLDLPLGAAHVPHRDAFEQLVVLLDRVAIVTRMVVVVVYAVLLDVVPARAVEVRGLEYPRVLQDAWIRIDVFGHGTRLLSLDALRTYLATSLVEGTLVLPYLVLRITYARILFIAGSKSGSSVTVAG